MLSRRQLMTCVLAVTCVAIVTAKGKECGDNPMKQVLLVAKRTGRSLDHVLTVLRAIDTPAYETLARRFRMYAACVGLVDTGYFRKRSQPPMDSQEMLPQLAYRSSPSSGHSMHKRLSDILAFPQNSNNWENLGHEYDVLYKKAASPVDSNLASRSFNDQLLDDADDMSRTILSLYTKAKQIVDAEKQRNQLSELPDDVMAHRSLPETYETEDFPFDNSYQK